VFGSQSICWHFFLSVQEINENKNTKRLKTLQEKNIWTHCNLSVEKHFETKLMNLSADHLTLRHMRPLLSALTMFAYWLKSRVLLMIHTYFLKIDWGVPDVTYLSLWDGTVGFKMSLRSPWLTSWCIKRDCMEMTDTVVIYCQKLLIFDKEVVFCLK
jgi:hypothetical protein